MKAKLLFFLFLLTVFSAKAQTQLWGMTSDESLYKNGTIFKTDGSGDNYNERPAFPFLKEDNPYYTNLVQATNGMLYGMTSKGGSGGVGVIFEYNPSTNIYTKKFDFDQSVSGGLPTGSLMQANDGMLYGMTSRGGANDSGVFFQYNPSTSIYIKKFDFTGSINGSNPGGSLIQASDGKLYGMTFKGGANNMGVLFQYDISSSAYTKKMDFNGLLNGSNPLGDLMQASDGMLYGMTNKGGLNNMGVLFQYNPSDSTCVKKLDFNGAANGSNPEGSLMQASDGMLYGMTYIGGTNSSGVLFRYDIATSIFTKKIDLPSNSKPMGSLIQANDGMLYGTTQGGGTLYGSLFQYNPITSTYTKKLSFDFLKYPMGSLMQASDGNLYGMTYGGGVYNEGGLFQYNITTTAYVGKISFRQAFGKDPYGSLIQANDGMLYGTTLYGGAGSLGVIFQYNPLTSVYTMKYEFNNTRINDTSKNINGCYPKGSLIQANDGMLYGMAYQGGLYGAGVLFQYNPVTSTYTKKFDFDGPVNGAWPLGALMQASDGMLYGTTTSGGTNNKGVLFQYNTATSTFTKKLDFDGTNGGSSYGSLIQASDGMFYGVGAAGAYNCGALLQYNPSFSTYIKKFDFDGPVNGRFPYGSLMQASDGMLYGMTNLGGANDKGVLFQYNPATSTFTKKLDFMGASNGERPRGSLMQASNGMLYGMTSYGGIYGVGYGTFFQFDPSTSVLIKKVDFNTPNGFPYYGNIIEIPVQLNTSIADTVLCAGNSINVNYFNTGSFNTGNVFTAELSDSVGSFVSSVTIGTLASIVSDSINAVIPGNIPAGTGYRIRVTSSNPVMTGTDNGSNIKINPQPSITIVASAISVCVGTPITLTGGGAISYVWSGGVADGVGFVPLSTTTYTVTGTDVNSCTNTDSITITINSLPPVTANATASAVCAGTTDTLTGGGAISYVWSGGVADGFGFIPLSTTTYTVIGTDVNTCTNIDSITITINSLPTVTTNTSASAVCVGTTVLLNGGGAISYVWSGSISDGVGFVPLSTSTYTVTGTDVNSCADTASISITVYPLPVLTITDPAIVCSPTAIDISLSTVIIGSSAGTISYWQDSIANVSLNSSYYTVIDTSGTYYIKLDSGGCFDIKPVIVSINNDCVWPGDANHDSIVNNFDLLPIGLYYSQTGSPRTSISNAWQAFPSTDWGTLQTNGSDIKQVDCNGNGLIDNNDTLAVNLNFSLTHAIVVNNYSEVRTGDPAIYFITPSNSYYAGDWVNVEVWTGSSILPVSNLYGIAFNINYDVSLVLPGTESLTYPNSSWLGTLGTNAITVAKTDPLAATSYGGITRIDLINANGFGKIADFKFQVKSNLQSPSTFHFSLSNYKANDAAGLPIIFDPSADSIVVYPLTTAIVSEASIQEFTISPNPFTSQTFITFKVEQKNTTIKIMDVLGKEIKILSFSGRELIIEKAEMEKGIYFVQVMDSNKNVINKKIILQ